MQNNVNNSELTVLLISDNDADIREVTKQLEKTMGLSCRLWHYPSVVRSSGFFKKALSEVDIVLLDLDLVAAGPPLEMFRQLKEIVQDIPIIVFTEREDHKLALLVVEEGAADNVTKGHFSSDPYKLRDAIKFALARAAISRDRQQKNHAENILLQDQGAHENNRARSHQVAALANAMAESSVLLDKTIANANENLRQVDELAVSQLTNAVEHGENLLADAKSEAAATIDQLNTANAELHREKDQTIHWLSGGYSMENNSGNST